jgi:putative tryptophan/tyrosine transport system substrate-binding protein
MPALVAPVRYPGGLWTAIGRNPRASSNTAGPPEQPGHSDDIVMKRHSARLILFLGLLWVSQGLPSGDAGAVELRRPYQIGVLTTSWGPTPWVAGLRDGLLALGYHEGRQFEIGVRFTQGDLAALPAAARDLVQFGVDLMVADSDHAAKAAQLATTHIPIVFTGVGDPVGMGLIQSFARPGGNLTGVTTLNLELAPKRLELFREIVPGLQRVLFPYDATEAYAAAEVQAYRDAARQLGIVLVEQPVRTLEEAQAALTQIEKDVVHGILKPRHSSLNIPGFMLETMAQRAIPTMFDHTWYVEQGGLASYGADGHAVGRQAARLVEKILKGAKPAEIPVEVNSELEFAINLKVAKVLGLTIAPEVVFRADRLIR